MDHINNTHINNMTQFILSNPLIQKETEQLRTVMLFVVIYCSLKVSF